MDTLWEEEDEVLELPEGDEFEDRVGRCYELSGQYILQHSDAVLVHGFITDKFHTGRVIAHAWVEEEDAVFDPVLDERYPKFLYYALFDAEVEYTYTQEETARWMLKTQHLAVGRN